jgi:hypothetical protein
VVHPILASIVHGRKGQESDLEANMQRTLLNLKAAAENQQMLDSN